MIVAITGYHEYRLMEGNNMICSAETLTLRDGRQCTVRSVEPEDAPLMLQYMKVMLGETPFLLRSPEEFDYTAEEEAAVLDGRKNNPRSLMLIVESARFVTPGLLQFLA